MAAIVTSKGRITFPRWVRQHLGVTPGAKVEFELLADGRVVMTKLDHDRPVSRFEKWRGSAGPGLSTDELMALLRD